MLYVGLDIHCKKITICVLDSQGVIVQRHQVQNCQELTDYLRRIGQPLAICYEASCGYGYFYDQLRSLAVRLVVAHPGRLKLIFASRKKNDRIDAERLAKLLYLNEVPAVHVPNQDVRQWREVIAMRRQLVQKRTRTKNGLRALLRGLAIEAPKKPGLWSKLGRNWLRGLSLPAGPALRRDLLLEELTHFDQSIRQVEQQLDAYAASSSAVAVLMSVPGVGVRTAEAFAAYLDDPWRFKNAKQVGSYFGLIPSQDQSGSKNRLGRITRQGSPVVRQFVTEAVWQARRRSPTVRAYYERIQREDKKRQKTAIVATGHYLVRVMYKLLKSGELWREQMLAA